MTIVVNKHCLSTSQDQCLFSKLAARMGACLFSWCANVIFWQCTVVWERITCVYFRPRGAFMLISVQCLQLFYNQRYSRQSIDCCQPPPINVKRLEPTNLREFVANSWIFFYQEALSKFRFYPVSIACLQAEIDTGKSSRYV